MAIKYKIKYIQLGLALLLIALGIVLRLVDHLPNFTPIGAIALFAGVYLSRRLSIYLPLLALLVSDFFIGFYSPALMIMVYGGFLLTVIVGWWLKTHKKWSNLVMASIFAGFIFFIITNFAVWVFTPWYAKTFSGLLQAYYLALPFFRNTLAGNLVYSFALFGSYELALILAKSKLNLSHSKI